MLVVSQGRICSDKFTCCLTETEVADQTFYLTQSQYTDTGPTSPSSNPITPGVWQESHWSANFWVTGMARSRKKSRRKRDSNTESSALEADALTTRPTRRWPKHTCAEIPWNISGVYQVQHVCPAEWRDSLAVRFDTTDNSFIFFFLNLTGWNHRAIQERMKPGYPEKDPQRQASENATYKSPKIQAPTETRTRTLALVAGDCSQSQRANPCTTCGPKCAVEILRWCWNIVSFLSFCTGAIVVCWLLPPSKAADMAHLCVPQNQALGVCRGFVHIIPS